MRRESVLTAIIGVAFLVGLLETAYGADLKIPKATIRYDSGVTYDATPAIKTPAPKPSLR